MTEEPYRWLEAIANRREYVLEQLRGGRPGFGISLPTGIVLAAPGEARTKVFEIHDRLAMVALGHPSDIERVRQMAIDAAHIEAFTRSSQDVNLRRLVSASLAPVIKQSFEQIFSPPFLVEVLFAELGVRPEDDVLLRLRPDGSFMAAKRSSVVWTEPAKEKEAAGKLEQWRGTADGEVSSALRRIEELAGEMVAEELVQKPPEAMEAPRGQAKGLDWGFLDRRRFGASAFVAGA